MAVELVEGFQDPDTKSKGLPWIQKDPSAQKDYQRDWSAWLDDAETITAATWVVHNDSWTVLAGSAGEVTVGTGGQAPSFDDTTATVWLLGGTPGTNYLITCRVTTSAGRVDDRSFQVRCIQR